MVQRKRKTRTPFNQSLSSGFYHLKMDRLFGCNRPCQRPKKTLASYRSSDFDRTTLNQSLWNKALACSTSECYQDRPLKHPFCEIQYSQKLRFFFFFLMGSSPSPLGPEPSTSLTLWGRGYTYDKDEFGFWRRFWQNSFRLIYKLSKQLNIVI